MPAGCCKTAVVKRVLFLSIRIVCTLHGAMRQGLLRCELLKMREIYFRQISGKEISFRDRNLEDGAAVHLVLMHGFCAAIGEVQLQATTARQALGASSAGRGVQAQHMQVAAMQVMTAGCQSACQMRSAGVCRDTMQFHQNHSFSPSGKICSRWRKDTGQTSLHAGQPMGADFCTCPSAATTSHHFKSH